MSRHLPFDRAQRVAEEIHRIVARVCHAELSDPRLTGVRITQVKVTRDLSIARLYFYLLQSDAAKREAARQGLLRAAGFLKREIGRELALKFLPEIEVFYDEGIDHAARIDELLAEGSKAS